MVGLFAEPAPPGFAFSDTAFRIFTLMNSRRLQSDRFFTTDFTEAVYTPEGMDWIKNASMTAVLRRHFPELRDPLDRHRELDPRGTGNPFKPWRIAPPASAAAS
jgi:Animal haem peroxidase